MIKPSIGRIVWFYHQRRSPHVRTHSPYLASIITHVWSDACINIAAFDSDGMCFSVTSVELIQDEQPPPPEPHCCWMPYQKGQAAKLEDALKDTELLKAMVGAAGGVDKPR